MLAMSVDGSGALRMVVDNPLHAAGALREQHYQVEERDVLYATVPNEPGSLGRVVKMLAEAGINLEYAYASGIDSVPMVAVVLGVADAQGLGRDGNLSLMPFRNVHSAPFKGLLKTD